MIDLHCHSTASDGAVSPCALPRLAASEGTTCLALTDHDTTDGVEEFLASAQQLPNFQAVPGVELSTLTSFGEQCHIVGLFLDWRTPAFQELLNNLRRWREERNDQILANLRELGKHVTREEAIACGGEDCVLGRPHIALAMVKRGYCRTVQEAFVKYLGRGKPAYASRRMATATEAIRAIHAAGAVTVWAHPMTNSSMGGHKLARTLDELCAAGLDALEAYYPEHTPTQTANVLRAAQERSLLVSGGSDFHGGGVHLGIRIGLGNAKEPLVPEHLLAPLQERASEIKRMNAYG
ncbi:MAG: PHP domain-containing protein [Victivallales bacterium]|nr:PHP domain-containing protein [Victivallales bacterium]